MCFVLLYFLSLHLPRPWLSFIHLPFLAEAVGSYQLLNYLKCFKDPIEFKYCYERGLCNRFPRICVVSFSLKENAFVLAVSILAKIFQGVAFLKGTWFSNMATLPADHTRIAFTSDSRTKTRSSAKGQEYCNLFRRQSLPPLLQEGCIQFHPWFSILLVILEGKLLCQL